ncbi:Mur ligase family protein [Bdellovibrio sp. HCB337]|uniref:Mur ligase family protein n=1 Tax=Bdellovibrio sp. HCB337 TaxID=3394358 RepID=UPI0039A6EDEA
MQRLAFDLLSAKPKTGAPYEPSLNLREFLFGAALRRRPELPTRIAAITGSNGKTTVKEMLGSILKTWSAKKSQPTYISPANQNTKLALALQILRLPVETTFATFEIGARRMGDFQTPFSYVAPQVVTLLNVGTAHAGEFGSLENLTQEKLSALEFSSTEILVFFGDDIRILQKAHTQNKKLLSFGFLPHNDLQILAETEDGISVRFKSDAFWVPCNYGGPQKALNMAAAFATAFALGLPINDIVTGLENFKGVERRFQRFKWLGRPAIDDAFNASPESMKEGLQYLASIAGSRKLLLVLGSMLELGEYTQRAHEELGNFILKTFPQKNFNLVLIGEETQATLKTAQAQLFSGQVKHFMTSADAKPYVEELAPSSEIIYFKASKGLQLQKIFVRYE